MSEKKQRNFLRIRHAKEYLDGVRKNPFFLKASPKSWLMIGAGALLMAGIITATVAFSYLPMFRLTSITITGTNIIDPVALQENIEEQIVKSRYPLLAQNNAYLMRTSAIEYRLMNNFALDSVQVRREGTTLVVVVKEKIMTIALRTKEKTLFLGLDGAYVRDATAEESRAIDVRIGTAVANDGEAVRPIQSEMPVVLDTQNDPATSLPQDSVNHLLDISTQLNSQGVLVKTFTFDGATALFTRVDTNEAYDLYFDLNHSVSDQMTALNAILAEPGFLPPSEYIDLRFGAYVYMK